MRGKVNRFATQIGQDIAHLLFQDQNKVISNTMETGGYSVDATWTPSRREGEFSDFDFLVEPYSMAYQSPIQRAQVLRQQVQELLPMMPLLQQQGVEFDVQRYLEIQSELLDIPRLLEIFRFDGTAEAGSQDKSSSQSAITSRNNTRTSVRGGATDRAQNQDMMQELLSGMGNEPQPGSGQTAGSF